MDNDFSTQFFAWADDAGLSRDELAKELNKETQTISNWRSRGVPKSQHVACRALMEKAQRKASDEDAQNKIAVEFTDEEMDLTIDVANTLGTPYREYITRSAVARARQDA